MENRKLIYFFGLLFSMIFAIGYTLLFHTFLQKDTTTSITLYYNQVGLYKSEDNANKVIQKLKEQSIDAYSFPQDDLHAVICSLSTNQETSKSQQEDLTRLQMNFIEKHLDIHDENIINALQNQEFDKALEMITNESKGNEQNGTST